MGIILKKFDNKFIEKLKRGKRTQNFFYYSTQKGFITELNIKFPPSFLPREVTKLLKLEKITTEQYYIGTPRVRINDAYEWVKTRPLKDVLVVPNYLKEYLDSKQLRGGWELWENEYKAAKSLGLGKKILNSNQIDKYHEAEGDHLSPYEEGFDMIISNGHVIHAYESDYIRDLDDLVNCKNEIIQFENIESFMLSVTFKSLPKWAIDKKINIER